MEVIKSKERIIKTRPVIAGLKAANAEVKSIGKFMKWKEVDCMGSRVSATITIYKVKANGTTCYFMSDTLDRMMCNMTPSLNEIEDWLLNHGYKTDKQFYMDDGMSEETWNEWNKGY